MPNTNCKILIDRALKCDQYGLLFQARHLYQLGVNAVVRLIDEGSTQRTDKSLFAGIEEYGARAEQITKYIKRMVQTSQLHFYMDIPNGECGYGYERVLGNYMTDRVMEVIIKEPNMCRPAHFQNLVFFLELLILKCKNLQYVEVVTNRDAASPAEQDAELDRITNDMTTFKKLMSFRYEQNLQETLLIFNTNQIIRILQHGLHYLHDSPTGIRIGARSQRFSKSQATTVYVFHTNAKM